MKYLSEEMSRRKYLKYVAGGIVGAAIVAGGTYWYMSTTGPKPKPNLRFLGYPFHLPQEGIEEWKAQTGQEIDATLDECFILPNRQISEMGSWDFGSSCRHRPLVTTNNLRPIPIEKIPRWQSDKVLDFFNDAGKYLETAQAERFDSLLWYEKGKSLICVPVMWNFDSVTYLPEFLPYEEHGAQKSISFSELWDAEWKDRAGLQDEGYQTFSEVVNELDATGQVSVSGALSNLTNEEVDQVYNFLLPIIKSGQIRAYWSKYGDIVNLLSAKEVYLASTWQPVCFDTRKAGVPAYYAALQNGPYVWFNAQYISKDCNTDALEDMYQLMNWMLSLWMQLLYTKQGYPSPAWKWDDYKNSMGEEFYNWFFLGKATYTPISDIMSEVFPDNPEYASLTERLQQGLFLPDVYFRHFWTGEQPRTGTPNSKGNLRDLGSVDEKLQTTRYLIGPDMPDNNDYYVTKWEELKANVPI